jgi:hypothetical protein
MGLDGTPDLRKALRDVYPWKLKGCGILEEKKKGKQSEP